MSASPPTKKTKMEGDDDGAGSSSVHTNGVSAKVSAFANDPKAQAKRIKTKLKDRTKTLAKTGEEPIFYDVCDLLGSDVVDALIAKGPEALYADKFPRGHQETVVVQRLSAHGDGLAVASSGDWVIAVPHALPGETALVRVYSNERLYSKADLVRIVEHAAESSSAAQRRDDLVGCKYFGQCSGCQYQNIRYDQQLALKQVVVHRAFRNYTGLASSSLPDVSPTLASPLQYTYRTKLTPHFELPRELRRGRRGNKEPPRSTNGVNTNGISLPDVAIGFDKLGEKTVMDIEECTIATKAINEALPVERSRVKTTIDRFKNGATLLLRDSMSTLDTTSEEAAQNAETVIVTDHRASVKERVGATKFLSPAGAFFQNNRSILPDLLRYVQEQIETHWPQTATSDNVGRYLVDAYCGSGLFSLCLAHLFTKVSGIEISQDSIKYAKENAKLNGIDNVDFVAGDAMEIFKQISFSPEQSVVIIDPPRRGCDEPFIRQLLELGPQLIVYVSCNVHTQARDVGQIVRGVAGSTASGASSISPKYEVLSIRGADLFPQTYHVEGVCVLRRVAM